MKTAIMQDKLLIFFRSWATKRLNFCVSWSVLNLMRKIYLHFELKTLTKTFTTKIKPYKVKLFIKDCRRKRKKLLRKIQICLHLLTKSLQFLVRNLSFSTVWPTTKVFILVLIKVLKSNHELFYQKTLQGYNSNILKEHI